MNARRRPAAAAAAAAILLVAAAPPPSRPAGDEDAGHKPPPNPADERIGAIVWRAAPDPGPIPHTVTYRGVSSDGRVRCVYLISESWTGSKTAAGFQIDTPSALSCVNQ